MFSFVKLYYTLFLHLDFINFIYQVSTNLNLIYNDEIIIYLRKKEIVLFFFY
jgi:hypothetical protein